jgi:hypothetical protein
MRRYRRRGKPQFLIPFLALISVGVVFILAFQVWGFFFPNNKGDAVLYIAEGRAKVLPFGKSEWENTYNGAKVKLGDSVKMQTGSKGVVSFYDGTVMRMDQGAEITLVDITKKSDYQEILLTLNKGNVWVNKPTKNAIRKTDFVINTNNASYSITGTIFDLEKNDLETLRVMKGQVQADIIESVDGRNRVIESIQVGLGQEINLDQASMQAFYERKSPSVLRALSTEFKSGAWYLWNTAEDDEPTDFASGQTSRIIMPEDGEDSENESENSDQLSSLEKPTISQPEGGALNTDADKQTIKGKAAVGTKQVIVKQLLAGETDEKKILLDNFDPEKLDFSYEISLAEENIKEGTNIYRVVGIDENALETAAVEVEIVYKGDAENTEDDEEDEADTETVALGKPVATSVNGKTYTSGMEVKEDIVIAGTIAGAEKVFVNDYQLSKFTSGSTSWSYNAKVSLGNLKAGNNVYEIYGVDKAGKKSAVIEVTVKYTGEVEQPKPVTPVNTPEQPLTPPVEETETPVTPAEEEEPEEAPVTEEPVVESGF